MREDCNKRRRLAGWRVKRVVSGINFILISTFQLVNSKLEIVSLLAEKYIGDSDSWQHKENVNITIVF